MVFRHLLGYLLIIIGIFGLFLPMMQGIALILLGVFILKREKFDAIVKRVNTWKDKWLEKKWK
ncbi:hypothetical protein HYS48_03455 [Candidatus Woesearchaeota archaeon]|nr:hypothetical protein [Candidatus Woesearchaeota archaeon]